nr:hypothetical protein BaRGS_031790 [Batillaria attramentaria]
MIVCGLWIVPPCQVIPTTGSVRLPLHDHRLSTMTATDAAAGRLNTTAYPPANGYDYYRQPAERADLRGGASATDYYSAPRSAGAAYDRNGAANAYDRGAGAYGRGPAQAETDLPMMFAPPTERTIQGQLKQQYVA